jgi:hypothetical protein
LIKNEFIANKTDFSANQVLLEKNQKLFVFTKTQFQVPKPPTNVISEALDTNTSPPVTSQPQTKYDSSNTISTRIDPFRHCEIIASCQESLHDTTECQVNAIQLDDPDPVISGRLSESTEHQNVEVNMEAMSTIAPLLYLLTVVFVITFLVCFTFNRQGCQLEKWSIPRNIFTVPDQQACPGLRLVWEERPFSFRSVWGEPSIFFPQQWGERPFSFRSVWGERLFFFRSVGRLLRSLGFSYCPF